MSYFLSLLRNRNRNRLVVLAAERLVLPSVTRVGFDTVMTSYPLPFAVQNDLVLSPAPMELLRVEHVDHLAKSAVVFAVEIEGDSREVQELVIFTLLEGWLCRVDLLSDDDVREVLIERVDRGR